MATVEIPQLKICTSENFTHGNIMLQTKDKICCSHIKIITAVPFSFQQFYVQRLNFYVYLIVIVNLTYFKICKKFYN